MPDIIINIAGKVFINFTPLNIKMIRGEANSVPVVINYTQGTGQTLTNGSTLTFGTSGQPNYTQLVFPNGANFSGTGSVNATVNSTPGSTVADGAVTFTVDSSTITINIDYDSRPTVQDINVPTLIFAGTKTFTLSDFTDVSQGNYQDFDGHPLKDIMITGNVTDFFYPNPSTPLQANTWIPSANIASGQLTFKGSSNQLNGYSISEPYIVRDSTNLESL